MSAVALPDLGEAEGTAMMVAGLVAIVAVIYVMKNPASLGKAAVGAAGAVVTGTVDAASTAVGIPTTEQTTTDPAVARWLIDNYGYLDASKWCGVPALFNGALMAAGTGTPPPAGSAVAAAHPLASDPTSAAATLQTGTIDYGSDRKSVV